MRGIRDVLRFNLATGTFRMQNRSESIRHLSLSLSLFSFPCLPAPSLFNFLPSILLREYLNITWNYPATSTISGLLKCKYELRFEWFSISVILKVNFISDIFIEGWGMNWTDYWMIIVCGAAHSSLYTAELKNPNKFSFQLFTIG